jgi:hypothetical protein
MHLVCFFVVLSVGSGLATGWSADQGVLPIVYRIKKLKRQPRSNKRAVEPETDKVSYIYMALLNRAFIFCPICMLILVWHAAQPSAYTSHRNTHKHANTHSYNNISNIRAVAPNAVQQNFNEDILKNCLRPFNYLYEQIISKPITVAARSKAWNCLCLLERGLRIPLKAWMSVCLYFVCFFLFCATGWSPVQGVLPTTCKIKKLKKRPRSNKGL